METELKKAIFDYMIYNKEYQLVNATTNKFRQYIYTPEGDFCIGGQRVAEFVVSVDRLLQTN